MRPRRVCDAPFCGSVKNGQLLAKGEDFRHQFHTRRKEGTGLVSARHPKVGWDFRYLQGVTEQRDARLRCLWPTAAHRRQEPVSRELARSAHASRTSTRQTGLRIMRVADGFENEGGQPNKPPMPQTPVDRCSTRAITRLPGAV
jgi:hypothetical protein